MHIETSTQKNSVEEIDPHTIINAEDFHDPLLALFKRLGLNYWWIVAGMGVLSATGLYSWLLLGTLTPLQVLFGSIVVPLWMGIYLFLPHTMADLYNRLGRNGVIGEYCGEGPRPMTYKQFVAKQVRWIHSRWWVGVALFLLALYWFYRFLPGDPLKYGPLWLQGIVIFVFSLVGYIGFLSIVWLLSTVLSTNRLCRVFKIQVKPLHPDGSGGLGVFNHFLWISIALAMIGACSAISVGLHNFDVPYMLAAIVCYVITLPILLAAWLLMPHYAMVQARDEVLQPITDEYDQAINETMPSAKGNTAAIIDGTKRLAALQKRYKQIRDSFPTWPIEVVQLHRLAIVLILPLLFSLLPSLLGLLK